MTGIVVGGWRVFCRGFAKLFCIVVNTVICAHAIGEDRGVYTEVILLPLQHYFKSKKLKIVDQYMAMMQRLFHWDTIEVDQWGMTNITPVGDSRS